MFEPQRDQQSDIPRCSTTSRSPLFKLHIVQFHTSSLYFFELVPFPCYTESVELCSVTSSVGRVVPGFLEIVTVRVIPFIDFLETRDRG